MKSDPSVKLQPACLSLFMASLEATRVLRSYQGLHAQARKNFQISIAMDKKKGGILECSMYYLVDGGGGGMLDSGCDSSGDDIHVSVYSQKCINQMSA